MLTANREVLKTAGLRVTSQRSLIMDIIHRGHLDADEIYRQARRKDSHLSLSTVYRSLQAFKKLGLVEEPESRNFDITETEIRMAGYCAECRRKQKEHAG